MSQILHDIAFGPLSIFSDLEDKSQYYFPNLNVSGINWVREQFPTNWISLTYRLRRSYSWLTVQLAENCVLS